MQVYTKEKFGREPIRGDAYLANNVIDAIELDKAGILNLYLHW